MHRALSTSSRLHPRQLYSCQRRSLANNLPCSALDRSMSSHHTPTPVHTLPKSPVGGWPSQSPPQKFLSKTARLVLLHKTAHSCTACTALSSLHWLPLARFGQFCSNDGCGSMCKQHNTLSCSLAYATHNSRTVSMPNTIHPVAFAPSVLNPSPKKTYAQALMVHSVTRNHKPLHGYACKKSNTSRSIRTQVPADVQKA